MSEADDREARLARLRDEHRPTALVGWCRTCGQDSGRDWPCDVAFLLGVIDAMSRGRASVRLGAKLPPGDPLPDIDPASPDMTFDDVETIDDE